MPKWYLTTANDVDEAGVPAWTSDLIIGEVNLRTATEEGTIESATKVLDHYAEMGINGIWITPVFDAGQSGNGYGNIGIDSIDPNLTGVNDYVKGWKVLKNFIDKAHEKNIRVILDVVFRGVTKDSYLVGLHPNWFTEDTQYGTMMFKWQDSTVNGEIINWYSRNIVSIAKQTGCDGFRYDMMPATTSGTNAEATITTALHNAGIYPFLISESVNNRSNSYATETVSIKSALSYDFYRNPVNLFLDRYNIIDFIKQGNSDLNALGTYQYYTYSLTNHDFKTQVICGNKLAMGYQAIYSPFIPIIYLGEEWNNSHVSSQNDTAMYYNSTDWSLLDNGVNRNFYESVKKMIAIRRTYPGLFNPNEAHFVDSNIVEVQTSGEGGLPAYARYANGMAAVVIPNYNNVAKDITVNLNLSQLGITAGDLVVQNAWNYDVIARGSNVSNFTVRVEANDQVVLIVKRK